MTYKYYELEFEKRDDIPSVFLNDTMNQLAFEGEVLLAFDDGFGVESTPDMEW
jgi:hypothetical protein